MRGQAEVVLLPPDNIDWTKLSFHVLILVDYTDYTAFSAPVFITFVI